MLKNLLTSIVRNVSGALGGPTSLNGAVNTAITKATSAPLNKDKTFTFQALPMDVDDIKAMPEADLKDMYAVAALSLLALTRYETDREACFRMLDFLKGPDPMNPSEKQTINDRFMDGKYYKVKSFFEGATPANSYTPAQPYKVKVSSNPYSFQNQGWATLYLHSGGADNPRPVRLRLKPSTGQWFLVEIQYLGDIRIPAAEDKWK